MECLISNYPGLKIQKVKTICPISYTECERDAVEWCDLVEDTLYNVALPSFLADNLDRKIFNVQKRKRKHDVGTMTDYDCLKDHMIKLGTIDTKIEGRIVIKFDDLEVTTEKYNLSTRETSSILLMFAFVLFIKAF